MIATAGEIGNDRARAALRRLGGALLVSLALHALVLALVRATPPRVAQGGPSALTALLQGVAPAPPAAQAVPAVPDPDALVPEAARATAAPEPAPEPQSAPIAPAATEPPRAAATAPVAPTPAAGPLANAPSESPAASLELPVIRDPTYYAARLLDEYPRPLAAVEPVYPERAAADQVGGKVLLLLLIDETGALNDITVLEAQPAGYFEEAALAAFRAVRFSPARKGGRAVRSRILITVGFEPGAPGPTPAARPPEAVSPGEQRVGAHPDR